MPGGFVEKIAAICRLVLCYLDLGPGTTGRWPVGRRQRKKR